MVSPPLPMTRPTRPFGQSTTAYTHNAGTTTTTSGGGGGTKPPPPTTTTTGGRRRVRRERKRFCAACVRQAPMPACLRVARACLLLSRACA